MRHRRGLRKLSRATDQRIALLRSLTAALFIHGRIKTTLIRAKETKKMAERLITLAKKGDLAARRRVSAVLSYHPKVVKELFSSAPARFEGRPGGYTRLIKIGHRRGDNAPLALLELI